MPRVAFPITNFQFADGSPVANGYIDIRLNRDGSANDTQLQRNFTRITLDASGNIIGSPTFWTNASISPSGTYYVYNIYSKFGLLVAGPNNITV